MDMDKATKDRAISEIGKIDFDEAFKLVVALKVALLADVDANGGLNAPSRARAWRMVNDLGKILRGRA